MSTFLRPNDVLDIELNEVDGTSVKQNTYLGSTEIWTRIAGFRVLSANHYTMEPCGEDEGQLSPYTL